MTGKVLTFYLADSLFGVDITLVKEINRNVEYTPIPDANNDIVGLFNMRGQIVTLFNMAAILGYGTAEKEDGSACIILKALPNDSDQVGFLIDRFGDVFDISDDDCEPLPANAGGIDGEYVSSVVKLKQELLMIIDPEEIFSGR